MFYKGKDTIKDQIAMQKKYKKAFRVLEGERNLIYHYAGIETIWKILEGDTFLSRNIRFSNDSEEYKLGEKKVSEYAEDILSEEQFAKFQTRIQQGVQEFYMICFCKDGDLLSQWRGYAKDGVSLGMDFSEENDERQECTQMFTVLNNNNNRKTGKYECDGKYIRFVEMPYQVFYVPQDGTVSEEKICKLKDAFESFEDSDTRTDMLINLIPFIKDDGFAEEDEYRIIFNMSDLGGTETQNRREMQKKIEYLERDKRKLPNIIVEMGDCEKKINSVETVILGKNIEIKAKETGKSRLEIDEIYEFVENELKNKNISCERSSSKEDIYIGEGMDQEDIMSLIEEALQQKDISIDYERGVKIWCRGHLPIRKVIIGPGDQKQKIKESLKHYMRNTYWLRYVQVEDSKIPLQN